MGRKKPTVAGTAAAAAAAAEDVEGHHSMAVSKKGKKKGAAVVDDDEYMIAQDEEQDAQSLSSTQQRSPANGEESLPAGAVADLSSSFGELGLSQKKTSKGKNALNVDTDPERSVCGPEAMAVMGKKKGKRGKKGSQAEDEDYDLLPPGNSTKDDVEQEEFTHEEETLVFTGKKKDKKGKKGFQADEDYDLRPAENEVRVGADLEGSIDEEAVTFIVKRKGKNGKKGFQVEDEEFDASSMENSAKIDADADGSIDDKTVAFTGKKKGKKGKQGFQAEDEDFDSPSVENVVKVDADLEGSIDEETLAFTGKKKGKKGKKGFQPEDQDHDLPIPDIAANVDMEMEVSVGDEEAEALPGKKKGKKGKKVFVVEDENYKSEVTLSEDLQKNYSKMDNKGGNLAKEGEFDECPDSGDAGLVFRDETIAFTGKKKGKKGKKSLHIDEDEYGIIDTASTQIEVTSLTDADPLSTKPKKKDRALVEEEELSVKAVEDASVVTFNLLDSMNTEESVDDLTGTSKKKQKKSKKSGKTDQGQDDPFSILAELEASEESLDISHPHVEDSPQSSYGLGDATVDGLVDFSGLKKKKKKGSGETKKQVDDTDSITVEVEVSKSSIDAVPLKSFEIIPKQASIEEPKPVPSDNLEVSSKKKSKKGKKSGRTMQEEEDLDAILAELEGPKVEKPLITEPLKPEVIAQPPMVQESDSLQDNKEAENIEVGELVESAAAKKKKKKKEKEKEKKAANEQQASLKAADEKQEAAKNKQPEKKVPKHVREMQERLAKQKELEEKRRQEEEEKQKKEEEEQRRLEELERLKEEAKRRRKEREKEKLLKKKQEGKLLTGKQKEEAKRLALMREQLLAQSGLSLDSDTSTKEDMVAPPKKPKYETKKKRRPHITEQGSFEERSMEEGVEASVEAEILTEKPDVEKRDEILMQEEEAAEDEEMEDWDARSWDDEVFLPAVKSAFAEEEENDKFSKIIKRVVAQPASDAAVSSTPASPSKSTVETKPLKQQPSKQIENKMGQSKHETDESEDESESEEEDLEVKRRREAALKREARKAEALAKRSAEDLRSPICCILGHVDTGKTKLLDCIRKTNVQEGEAGGITQQIGATYFPMENIKERTKELDPGASLRVPGLLVIDTPGHESFTNLRSRGSSLCDIAILVIDIMHGLEPQTIESLNLLKMRHTPFVVALNKVDRLYGWKSCPNAPIQTALTKQVQDAVHEFQTRLNHAMNQLQEQGMNSEVYYKNKDRRKYVSIVPTSAISGEGIPDLLILLVELTQKMMKDKLMYISEVECTVLEVKVVEGLGTTIDVILVNGVLHEGDQIVVCGMQGPIVTNIRALLTPHPMKELRVKGTYQHHKELKAAQGIKITAQGLEHAIAGTQLHVVGPDDDLEDVKEEAMQDMKSVMSRIDKSGEGVCVQASTLGSLEALLEFLKSPAVQIPVSGISIGPVHKRDVMRASVMLERKSKEYATILAFDVKVTPEAKELAEELGVKIFMADIIYHLFDQFTAFMNNVKEEKKKEVAEEAVFPCVLKILPQCIFNKKDPIIVGVDVLEGVARVGTPLCVPSRDSIDIGRIVSMEVNHKIVDTAKKGQAVAMKIAGSMPEEMQKMYGRHFDHEDELVSHITRRSIDVLKESYRDELSMEEWRLLVKLKKLFNIP